MIPIQDKVNFVQMFFYMWFVHSNGQGHYLKPHIGLSNRIGFTFILLLLMNWACRNVWACLLAVTRQQPAHLSKLKGRPTLFYRPKSSMVNKLKVNCKAMCMTKMNSLITLTERGEEVYSLVTSNGLGNLNSPLNSCSRLFS